MVEVIPMTDAVFKELARFLSTPTDDPVLEDRKKRMVLALLDTEPELKEEMIEEGRREGVRANLRRVLGQREIVLAPEDEARINACTDSATLRRWFERAVDAESAAEVLGS
jgi:hypothetical protein